MNHSTNIQKSQTLTIIGMIIMIALVITKAVPSLQVAGYSVFVGLAFFFIVEAVGKVPNDQSGLRFNTFFADIKKRGVLPLVLLPIATAIGTLLIGDWLFNGEYSAHVIGRTDSILSFDKIPLLAVQVLLAAFGEEIAWRGFFLGKSMQKFPFILCAVVSSALFAVAHFAVGGFALVFYDIATIFIDSMIYSLIYRKTGNCLISTVSHILCNATGFVVVFVFA